jgi:hypothetical protein
VKYVRSNFLCGLLGQEPSGLEELNARLQEGFRRLPIEVFMAPHMKSRRVAGRQKENIFARVNGRPPYPYVDEELRRVARAFNYPQVEHP